MVMVMVVVMVVVMVTVMVIVMVMVMMAPSRSWKTPCDQLKCLMIACDILDAENDDCGDDGEADGGDHMVNLLMTVKLMVVITW
jgi:Na+-transporting NADH:ubiquinone oxidoreductase subunit NqrC